MHTIFFFRKQSQKSLHLAGCFWRYFMWNCVLVLDGNACDNLVQECKLSKWSTQFLVDWGATLFVYQTKLLKKAMTMLDNDKQIKKEERERTLAERVPALQMSGLSLQDLQVSVTLAFTLCLGFDSKNSQHYITAETLQEWCNVHPGHFATLQTICFLFFFANVLKKLLTMWQLLPPQYNQ